MDKQQWDLEFDKAMDDKFVTQQLIMEITDQIEELEKRKAGYLQVQTNARLKLEELQEILKNGKVEPEKDAED